MGICEGATCAGPEPLRFLGDSQWPHSDWSQLIGWGRDWGSDTAEGAGRDGGSGGGSPQTQHSLMWGWPPHSWGHGAWAPWRPARVNVGADRGKDYSWVLAHARAGICRPLARNDVGLVLSNPAVTAGASAPLLLGSWAGTCAPCNHLCPLIPSSCSALDESPH